MTDYERLRRNMVDAQIARRGIRDEQVLAAMRTVPRERFADANIAEFAYEDTPLPIAENQTISQPLIVAEMLEAAEIAPRPAGTGSRRRLRLRGGGGRTSR